MTRHDQAAPVLLDGLLTRVANSAPDLDDTLTNHAPMVIDALCALGYADAAPAWLERYSCRFKARARTAAAIDPEDYETSLGRHDRFADWYAFYAGELARESWQRVVRRWGARLAPGLSGAATHGVIRAGHAARSLALADTPARRDELAAALAYWAATYRTLPMHEAPPAPDCVTAIERIPFLPTGLRRHAGSIDAALAPLATWAPFAGVGALLDPGTDVDATIEALSLLFARVYLANAIDWLTTIVFVHALTSLKAVQRLARLLDATARRDAVRFAWQAAAALYVAYGVRGPAPLLEAASDDPRALAAAAVAGGDEHAIKVTETCLDNYRRDARPEHLAVARHAIAQLS